MSMNRASVIAALVLGLLLVGGCLSDGEMERTESEVIQAKIAAEQAREEKAALDALLAATPPEERPAELVAKSVELDERIGRALDAIAVLEQKLGQAEAGVETAGDITGVVAPFAGPYAPVVTAIAGLVLGLFRSSQQKRRARAVVRSIEALKAAGKISLEDPVTKRVLDSVQGAEGKLLVDELQGRSAAVAF